MNRNRTLAVVLLGLLAVSLAANVILYRMGSQFFLELSRVRLDPVGLAVHAGEAVPPLGPGDRRVVFFGDSRALMWATPDAHGFQFVNRGVGQQTTAQILSRFDAEIPALHPDILVVELGVNDLKTIPLFPSRRAEIIETTKRNIHEIVRRARALGAAVIVATIFPVGPVSLARAPFWSDQVALAISEVNADLVALSAEGVTVLRANDVLLDERGKLRGPFAQDLLHLTPLAYAALNEQKLAPALAALR